SCPQPDDDIRLYAHRVLYIAPGVDSFYTLTTSDKKLTMYTHENVCWGKIHLPEQDLQTTSFWCSLPERAVAGWPKERVEVALAGLGNLLHGLAPLLLMCAPHDLGLAVEVRSPHTERP